MNTYADATKEGINESIHVLYPDGFKDYEKTKSKDMEI